MPELRAVLGTNEPFLGATHLHRSQSYVPASPFSLLLSVQALLAICLLTAGCSDGKSSVTGSVTLDGQPISQGAITFVKQGSVLTREGAVITGGAFHATLPPGEYKVELNAQKVVGKRKQKGFDGKDEELEITEEAFP